MIGISKYILKVLLVFLAFIPTDGTSETLEAALAHAYETSPSLEAQRASARVRDENLPQAQANYRPSVSFESSYGKTKNQYKGYDAGTGLSETGSSSLTLNQKVLDLQHAPKVEKAEAQIESAHADLSQTEQKILLEVIEAYMSLYSEMKALEAVEGVLKFTGENLKAVQIRYNAGDVTLTDLSQAKSRYSSTEARYAQSKARVEAAREDYKKVVGKEAPLVLSRPVMPADMPGSLQSVKDGALLNSPIIIKAKADERHADSTVKESSRAYLPTVNFSATAGRNWQRRSLRYRQDQAVVKATLSMPLDVSGTLQSSTRQAHDNFVQKRVEVEVAKRAAQKEAVQAWENYIASKRRVTNFKESIEASKQALESIQVEHSVGSRTVLDVLDASKELLNAEVDEATSYKELIVSSYQVLAAQGSLTVQHLKLPVRVYDAKAHLKEVDGKWWGLGSSLEGFPSSGDK